MTQAVRASEPRTYRAAPSKNLGEDADPVTTEVVRHSLQVAANYMKRALVRTSFSPTIYEVLDFAAAIYDREVRMLAQAPTLPLFMGTMNFCVEAAVEAVGGEDALEPGDIILYNDPFGTGSHQQDAALIMPVFYRDETLIGYTGIKAHLQDIGGKEPYSTDTVDVFQEGTIFPGLKLYKRGELSDEVHRMLVANSRVPKYVVGDVEALVVAVRAGAAALCDVVDRFGLEEVETCVERMYDHGEAVIRSYFEKIPDGRYVAHGMMDNNGVDTDSIPFEVALEVEGSTVRVDYSNSPPMQNGPVNCPIASTVSATRMAIMWIAGGGDNVNEGYFRPVEIVTRPGTMFDPVWPAPSFLYFIPAMQAMEVILRAMSEVMPEAVPAASDCDIQATVWWGVDEETGEPWAEGMPHMGGQGAWSRERRPKLPDAPDGGGDPQHSVRGLRIPRSLADHQVRDGARHLRPRPAPGRTGARHGLHHAGRFFRHGRHRAQQVQGMGSCGRRGGLPRQRRLRAPRRRRARDHHQGDSAEAGRRRDA